MTRLITCALLAVALSACSTAPKQTTGRPADSCFGKGDAAPSAPLDIASIPEPVPRIEPPSKYGNPPFYTVNGQTYRTLASCAGYVERGIASWYGVKFHGRRTSSGEPYDMYAISAAHKTLPLPCYVRVTNLQNGRSLIVRVNDRGPFIGDRLIDLSYAAAAKLGILGHGTGLVEVRALDAAAPQEPERVTADKAERQETHRAPSAENVYLQVGAFQNLDGAERLRARLLDKITDEIQIIRTTLNDALLYRVRIGPLVTSDDAGRLAESLAHLGIAGARIVTD
ncbi:MAG: septal ring lytic transglycosylase RlpA family protein [Gammaproteobacteria bacterium]|nr:MAG: septal ring lytic transglycosylase RlpA family protein [Gammaproteobacteria bacterium]